MADTTTVDPDAPIVGTAWKDAAATGEAPPLPISNPGMDAHNAAVADQGQADDGRGFWDRANSAVDNSITWSMMGAANRAQATPDPNYNVDAFDKQFSAMVKTGQIDGRTLADNIGSPVSEADFNARAEAIYDYQKRSADIERGGWSGKAANLLVGVADPASLALMAGTGGVVGAVPKLAALGTFARGAVEAGLSAVPITAAEHAVTPVAPATAGDSLNDYAMAVGSSLIFHGIVHGVTSGAVAGFEAANSHFRGTALLADAKSGALDQPSTIVSPAKGPKDGVSWHPDTEAHDKAVDLAKQAMTEPPAPAPHVVDQAVDAIKAHTSEMPGVSDTVEGLREPARTLADSTGLTGAGSKMAESMGESLRAHLWDKVTAGETSEMPGFPESRLLMEAKALRDGGSMPSRTEFDAFTKEFSERPKSGLGDHTELAKVAEATMPNKISPPTGAVGAMYVGHGSAFHDFKTADEFWMSPDDAAAVPKTVGTNSYGIAVRPGIGFALGSHKNAAVRMIGSAFFNDMSGKIGHALSGAAVQMNGKQLHLKLDSMYHTGVEPNFKAWAKSTGNSAWRMSSRQAFHEQVTAAMGDFRKDGDPTDFRHPEVVKAAGVAEKVYKEMAEHMSNPMLSQGGVGRPLGDAGTLKPDKGYFPRVYDHVKMMKAYRDLRGPQMEDLFKGAILKAQSHLSDDTAGTIARTMIDNVMKRLTGDTPTDLGDAFHNGDREAVAGYLRRSGLAEDRVNQVMTDLFHDRGQAGGISENLKSRVLLDHNHGIDVPGKEGEKFYFHDLLEHNQSRLMSDYLRRNTGRVALGQVRLRNPTTGDMMIDGITRDSEWAHVKQQIAKMDSERAQIGESSAADNQATQTHLDFAYNHMLNRGMPGDQTLSAAWLRMIRATGVPKMTNAGLFAHGSEGGAALTYTGVKAWLQHNPWMHAAFGSLKGPEAKQFLHEMHGYGYGLPDTHHLHAFDRNPFEHDNAFTGDSTHPILNSLTSKTQLVGQKIMQMSLLEPILGRQQTMAASGIAQRFYDMARRMQKGSAIPQGWKNLLAHANIGEDMHERIGTMLMENAKTKQGLFGEKIRGLNLDHWSDQEARAHLDHAIFQLSRKAIQSPDSSTAFASSAMSNPLAKMIVMFKSFVMQAWSNHLMYGANNLKDPNVYVGALAATASAAMLSYAHSFVKNGFDVNDPQFKKETETGHLAATAFQRSGWSSIIPNIIDTVAPAVTGTKAFFDNRASGSGSSMFQSPVTSTFSQFGTGVGEMARSMFGGDKMSKQGIRNLIFSIPGATFGPVQGAINAAIKHGALGNRPDFPARPQETHIVASIIHKFQGY